MDRYCWNDEKGMYFDYNFVEGKQTDYVSATTVFPLWAGLASLDQGKRVMYVDQHSRARLIGVQACMP